MNPLFEFFKKYNYRISKHDCGLFGIEDFDEQLKQIQESGIKIKWEIRTDLNEDFARFWLEDEKYREANR